MEGLEDLVVLLVRCFSLKCMFAEDATPKARSSMPDDMASEANRLHVLIHHAQVGHRLGVDIFEIAERP